MSDLISRQAAIDAVLNLSEKVADEMLFIDAIVDEIENLPSAVPEKWIPAEEVLPKDMDRILTTIVRSDGEKRVRSGHYYKGYFMMDNGDTWNGTDKEVIAWMPLVEPWRGDR